ncbi:MAG: stage V sporulation protein AB [Lachnospiraceae bacterium]|nr:stage V sporulation protein AB [Lachnospiraceae bacterium]
MLSKVLIMLVGFSAGALTSCGVTGVLMAVGLTPRFIGRVHEARHIYLFESMIIWGSAAGGVLGVYYDALAGILGTRPGRLLQVFYGFFAGIFVGSLAIAIAEMLEVFPVFTRRMRLERGLPYVLLAAAFGKSVGAFLYFYFGM